LVVTSALDALLPVYADPAAEEAAIVAAAAAAEAARIAETQKTRLTRIRERLDHMKAMLSLFFVRSILPLLLPRQEEWTDEPSLNQPQLELFALQELAMDASIGSLRSSLDCFISYIPCYPSWTSLSTHNAGRIPMEVFKQRYALFCDDHGLLPEKSVRSNRDRLAKYGFTIEEDKFPAFRQIRFKTAEEMASDTGGDSKRSGTMASGSLWGAQESHIADNDDETVVTLHRDAHGGWSRTLEQFVSAVCIRTGYDVDYVRIEELL